MAQSVTLITGASAGLGVEFARQCARRGETPLLVARRRERLEALASEIGGIAISADLSEPGASEGLTGEIAARGLVVATLINNAGFGLIGRVATLPAARQREMIDLNIGALTELTRSLLPSMIDRGEGAILNVASTAAFQPGPGMAVYFATKAFVLSFTEALHHEVKDLGIRVSALCPGPTATEFGQVAGVSGGRFDRLSADAASVVAAGLRGLDRNKAVVVPGLGNKITAQSSRFIPRAAMRRIVAALKI